MDQVAAAAGVSRATVSRVINNAASVAPGIRDAVQRAITQTGYVPNVAARSLVTRRSNSVALVISEPDRPDDHSFLNRIFTDPYFGRVTAGATGALRPHDVHLVVVPTDSADHHQVVRYLRQGHVDGVLLISSSEDDPLPAQVHSLGIPAVLASRPSGPLPVSYVDVDQRFGARLAAAHLLGRGCRRLATISGPLDIPAGADRLDAFREAAFSPPAGPSSAGASSASAGPASASAGPASPSAGPASSTGAASPSAGPFYPSAGAPSPSADALFTSAGAASPSAGPSSTSGAASPSGGPFSPSADVLLTSAGASSSSAGALFASAGAGSSWAGGSIPVEIGDFTRVGGEAAAHRLLDQYPDLDGLFVASDLMAEGALRALQDRGRRVPDDVAVVGFDDSSAALECRPLLTTVRQPVEEMAAEMAQLLIAHIDNPGRSPRSVIFQPTLVIRESA
ncbi:LacI family DNA-binding transcriptional regulator [Actinoplanes sp. NPDC026670]|uniref:LacI family DNA-binding transcriptional regulator n=1 Tax=Actinoplanes sp. NPDC026670 TaxID=3154700 RepID=UPI0033CDF1D8